MNNIDKLELIIKATILENKVGKKMSYGIWFLKHIYNIGSAICKQNRMSERHNSK